MPKKPGDFGDPADPPTPDADAAIEWPIDGVLDLHLFSPKDVESLIPEYLEACAARGIWEVRIIHGKGTGALRRTVHALLQRHPGVADFHLADETAGGWGATLVRLVAIAPASR